MIFLDRSFCLSNEGSNVSKIERSIFNTWLLYKCVLKSSRDKKKKTLKSESFNIKQIVGIRIYHWIYKNIIQSKLKNVNQEEKSQD